MSTGVPNKVVSECIYICNNQFACKAVLVKPRLGPINSTICCYGPSKTKHCTPCKYKLKE